MRLQSAIFWRARPSASIRWNSRRTRIDRLGGGVGNSSCTASLPRGTVAAPGATVAAAFNSRVSDNVVRLGVYYKFDSNEIWRY